MKPNLLNGANLAFIGDAYYELCIRKYCLELGITNQKDLHKTCVKYVSASAHYVIYEKMIEHNFFTDEEMIIFKRGRNHNYASNRKNVNQNEYVVSSGLEAVIGYLYLNNDLERLNLMIDFAIKTIEGKNE